MQHWAIFCILFRKLSIFAILTSHHCSFDRINYACTTLPGVGYNEFVCGSAPRLIPCQPPPIMCGPDHDVSEARDATEGWAEISWEQSGIIVAGRAANQMHRKLLGTFHSVFAVIFIQCQIWNKKDGAFTNNNGKIAFSASWWVSDKSPFRCKRD